MAYVKETWTSTKPLNAVDLIHMETQVTSGLADLTTHDATGHTGTYYTKTLMDSYFWSKDNDGDGSTLNADTLSGYHANAIVSGIQAGFMGWWDVRNGSIPSAWKFCDGTSGTLDMRGRFPLGAGSLGVGATGGNSTITPVGSIVIGYCTLTPRQMRHYHSITQYWYDVQWENMLAGGTGFSSYYAGSIYVQAVYTNTTLNSGGNTPHNHPGTFTGDSVTMLPVYNYLVVIQKS